MSATIFSHPLWQALGLSVLHSVWQGILIFCLVKMSLSFLSPKQAALRYRITYVGLSALFLLFTVSFVLEYRALNIAAPLGEVYASGQDRAGEHLLHTALSNGNRLWVSLFKSNYLASFHKYAPFISLFYAAGVLLLCFKMGYELLSVRRLGKGNLDVGSPFRERFLELQEAAGIKGKVLLQFSGKVNVSVMLGHLKPIILLPVALVNQLDIQQLETILLHELAHIKRNDYLWNILQTIMETFLFFNPAAWWLSVKVREEREHCCDDFVVDQSRETISYAHALLTLEEYRMASYPAAMAATGNNKSSSLFNRIKRITTMTPTKNNGQKKVAMVAVLVMTTALICIATAFGKDNKEKTTKKVVKYNTKEKVIIKDDQGNTRIFERNASDTTDFAAAMKAIPQAMGQLKELEGLKEEDWQEITGSIQEAIQGLDKAKMEEVRMAMAEARKEIDNVDWKAIRKDVEAAMKDVKVEMDKIDWASINKSVSEAEAAIQEINWDDVQQSMDEAKRSMKQLHKELKEQKKVNRPPSPPAAPAAPSIETPDAPPTPPVPSREE